MPIGSRAEKDADIKVQSFSRGFIVGVILGFLFTVAFYLTYPAMRLVTQWGVIHHFYYGIVFLGIALALSFTEHRFATGFFLGLGLVISADGLYWFQTYHGF